MPKISLPGSYKFRRVFFDRCSWWRKRRWNSLYGTPYIYPYIQENSLYLSWKNAPDQSEKESAPINALQSSGWQHGTRSGRMSLKKCVFGCEEKITLFSFPTRTHRYVNSGYSLFFRGSNGVPQVFVDERFINKAQFDAGFAHRLILKDGAVQL